jgi:DNA-binding transcriptional MerR regulator
MRLQHIRALKKAGCTLEQIRHLMAQRLIDPTTLLDLQIGSLQHQKDEVDRTLRVLKAARDRLVCGEHIGVAEFCNLIKLGECSMTEDAWKQVWDRYYTPEEQERWRAAKQQFSPTQMAETETAWSNLIARITAAIARGTKPEDDTAIALAKEWRDLQQPLVEKIGIETWNKSQKMYEHMDEWQSDKVQSPFSQEVYAFVLMAAEAARARGVIQPRAQIA